MSFYTLLYISILLPSLLLLAIFLCYFLQKIWHWIDDSEYESNKLISFIMINIFKFKKNKNVDCWNDNEGHYKSLKDSISLLCFGFFLLPAFIFLSIKFYAISLFLITCFLIIYMARFVRRLNKKFNLHCDDKEKHN